MQFSTLALSAMSIGSALAQLKVHVVQVGAANGSVKFFPDNIKANPGEMIQFQFAPNNHTVTQSTFDSPCQPIASHSNVTGVYSGFMPVSASSTTTPTWTIMVNNTTPMWLYCSQGKHCQNGMTMVINENSASNKTLAAYRAAAAKSTVNLPAGTVADGTAGSVASGSSSGSDSTSTSGSGSTGSSDSGSGSTSGSSSGTDSGAASGAGSNSTSSSSGSSSSGTTTVNTSAAPGGNIWIREAATLGAALAVGALFLL